MIAYVESNFILEIALLREEHEICLTLLNLAELRRIDLVLPAFSIGEPYEAWVRRAKQRRDLLNRLGTEIRDLSRSKPYRETSNELQELTNLLLRSVEEEKQRLDQTLERILNIAEMIPIDLDTIRAAISLQKTRSLAPQDSIVYASILVHLSKAAKVPRCFITTNARDFVNPDIIGDLSTHNCQLLTKFSDALGYIRRSL